MTRKPRLALLQTAIGDYRQQVLEELVAAPQIDFEALAGPSYFDGTTLTKVDLGDRLVPITNHFLAGNRFLWQSGGWRRLLSADVVIAEGNPRILSSWVLILARKALRRRTVVWGHAWPRSGKTSRTFKVRRLMNRLADAVVVYTETQASELREAMPGTAVFAAPNALYSKYRMQAVTGGSASNFIYVGRLVKEKKPALLVQAFQMAMGRLDSTCNLVIVGDGPERQKLEELAAPLGQRVQFKGHVADWESLRGFYAESIASVSPGYVGLSITQSFSFGVPMIIAEKEPHAPEIEAAKLGQNSLYFREDSAEDLAEKLIDVWKARAEWQSRRPSIAADCAARYSAEFMASRLIESAGLEPAERGTRPDRPVSSILNTARSLLRAVRFQRHRFALRGKLEVGTNVVIGPNAVLLPPEYARFGNNVAIASDFHLETNIQTGSDILISSRVSFVGNDHSFDDPESTVFWQGRNPPATVVLEGDNLIGFGTIVIGNVRIGKGCVVGAGAVVTSDLPPNTVCVGIPARPIRARYPGNENEVPAAA